jgi:polygalacturonase
MRRSRLCLSAGVLWAAAAGAASTPGAARAALDVCQFGAKGDGKTLCTAAIQKAIDRCAGGGGGTVHLPPGRYLSGTIFLRSGVTLHLADAATLLGSTDLSHYPETVPKFRSYTDNYTNKSLIYGEGLERVAITGGGTIDGQGRAFRGPYKRRPYVLRLVSCRHVRVCGVTFRSSPMWMQHYLACDDVRVSGVTVRSLVNANNDGLNIDCCHRVCVSDCNIHSGDDAIVLKSTADRPCKDVVVTNCVLRSRCNALKLGTESNGGFENIVLTGCAIYDTRLAGVALEIVDGGTMDRVVVANLVMRNVGAPVFLRLGDRARPFTDGTKRPPVGRLRNVTISNIQASGAGRTGCAISGLPDHPIENLTLSDLRLSFVGDGAREEAARAIPEKRASYPEFSMFGRLPAYGLFCRHVKGLTLRNVRLETARIDLRHAVVLDDASDVRIDSLDAAAAAGAAPMIRLTQVRGALIRGCRPRAPGALLQLAGKATGDVVLTGNDLTGVGTIAEVGADAPAGALTCLANRRRASPARGGSSAARAADP